jgi:metallo-beta-lactamase family protein
MGPAGPAGLTCAGELVKEGFAGDILLTPASKELFPVVILDSARIQEEDAAFKKKTP